MMTHDRYFLDNVTGWILELDRGKGIPYEGNYSATSTSKSKTPRTGIQGRIRAAKKRSMELAWIRQGAKARRKPRARRVSHAYETTARQKQTNTQVATRRSSFPNRPRLGQKCYQSRRYFQRLRRSRLLIDNLSFSLPPGGIVGVIGPNGAGKSTFFKMITDKEKPDSGTFTVGDIGEARLCRSDPRLARR
jgi:sulfate-transporting ATPase